MSGLSHYEINYLYKKGRKINTDNLVVFFLPFNQRQISIVVSKKISKKAVIRNKIKRRLKHLSRELLYNGKYLIVVKKDISNTNFEKLKNDFKKIINKTC